MEVMPSMTEIAIGSGTTAIGYSLYWGAALWTFDLNSGVWSHLQSLRGGAPALMSPGSCVANGRLIVFGGETDDDALSDALHIFDAERVEWSTILTPTIAGDTPNGRMELTMDAVQIGGTQFCIAFGGVDSKSNNLNEIRLLTDDQVDVGSRIGLDILGGFSFPAPDPDSELASILQSQLSDGQLAMFKQPMPNQFFSLPFARLAAAIGVYQSNAVGRAYLQILSSSSPLIDHEYSFLSHIESAPITRSLDIIGMPSKDGSTSRPTLHCPGSCFLVARAADVSNSVTMRNMILVGRTPNVTYVQARAQVNSVGFSAITIDSSSDFALIDCVLTNHTSGLFGSAISVFSSNFTMVRVNITDCRSKLSGGAIWGIKSLVTATDSTFEHNHVDPNLRAFDLNQFDTGTGAIPRFYRLKLCRVHTIDEFATSLASSSSFTPAQMSCFGFGGAIHLVGAYTNFHNTRFYQNSAVFGGGVTLDADVPDENSAVRTTMFIAGTVFEANTASLFGGAIFVNAYERFSDALTGGTFVSNRAPFGVIYSRQARNLQCLGLTFRNNVVSAGGALFWVSSLDGIKSASLNKENIPVVYESIMVNNSYLFGPIIASEPVRMAFIDANGTEIGRPNGFRSVQAGIDIDPPIRIGLFDTHNQLVRTENTIIISCAPVSTLSGIFIVQVTGGMAIFSGMQLQLHPTMTVNLTFTSSITLAYYDVKETTLPLLSRPCGPGEYVTANKCVACPAGRYTNETMAAECTPCEPGWSQGEEGSSACIPCPIGSATSRVGDTQCAQCPVDMHSWSVGSSECDPCGIGLTCANGTAVPVKGYWLAKSLRETGRTIVSEIATPEGTEFVSVIPCPNNNCVDSGNCNYGRINPPELNPLCAACQPGFTVVDSDCVACESTNVGLVFGALFAAAAITLVVYHLANTKRTASNTLTGNSESPVAKEESSATTGGFFNGLFALDCSDEVMTILTFFIQSFTFEIGTISDANRWMRVIGIDITATSSSSCFFPTDAYGHLFLNLFAPFLILLFLGVGVLLHRSLWLPAVLARIGMRRSRANEAIRQELNQRIKSHERQQSFPSQHATFNRDIASMKIKLEQQDSSLSLTPPSADTGVTHEIADTVSDSRLHSLAIDPFVFAPFGMPLPFELTVPRFSSTRYIRALAMMCMIIYQPVSRVVLSHLNCTSIGDRNVVFDSATISCDSDSYRHRVLPILILMAIFWVAGLPLMVVALWWKKRRLDAEHARTMPSNNASNRSDTRVVFEHRFGHFFDRFQPSVPWWHAIILCRTILILVVDLALFAEPRTKMIAFTNMMAIMLFVHLWIQPYVARLPNILESITLLFLVMVNAIALAHISFDRLPGAGSSVSDDAYTSDVQIVLVCFTLPIVLCLFLVILRLKLPRLMVSARAAHAAAAEWYHRRRGEQDAIQRELDRLEQQHTEYVKRNQDDEAEQRVGTADQDRDKNPMFNEFLYDDASKASTARAHDRPIDSNAVELEVITHGRQQTEPTSSVQHPARSKHEEDQVQL